VNGVAFGALPTVESSTHRENPDENAKLVTNTLTLTILAVS
jgi:hypothetical protein